MSDINEIISEQEQLLPNYYYLDLLPELEEQKVISVDIREVILETFLFFDFSFVFNFEHERLQDWYVLCNAIYLSLHFSKVNFVLCELVLQVH